MAVDKDFIAKVEELIEASDRVRLDLHEFSLPDEETMRQVLPIIATKIPGLRELTVSFRFHGTDAFFGTFLRLTQSLTLEDGRSLLARLYKLDLSSTRVGDESLILLVEAAQAGHLTGLQELNLRSTDVGDESLKLLTAAVQSGQLAKLRSLDVSQTEVGDEGVKLLGAAAQAGYFTGLQDLNLSDNEVGDEGVSVLAEAAQAGRLACLRDIDLSETEVGDGSVKLLAAAATAGHLTSLRDINLAGTQVGDKSVQLFAVAAKAGRLSSLRGINLERTDVGDNSLKLLAEAAQAGYLTELETLNLSDTNISDESVKLLASAAKDGRLTQLLSLNLDCYSVGDESLKALAEAAQSGHLSKLWHLRLDGDYDRLKNLTCVDPAILDTRNASQIFEAVSQGSAIREARIILLGSEAVGKTWLRRRIFQDEIVSKTELRKETHDIDLRQSLWKPKIFVEDGRYLAVELGVWDFAGQLIAHGVHETFLAHDGRTVCILVLDAKRVPDSHKERGKELGNRLEYWLRTIAHFAGEEVPVVIAITKCDDVDPQNRPIDQPLPQLRMSVSQSAPDDLTKLFKTRVVAIVDDCSACGSKRSIEPLRYAIEAALSGLSSLKNAKVPRKLIPLRWKIQQELRQHPFVSREQFVQWCRGDGVELTDSNECDSYLRILHHMGSLFYFGLTDGEQRERSREGRNWLRRFAPGRQRIMRKEPSRLLSDYVINTDWLKWTVYCLIERSEKNPWITRDEIAYHVADSDLRMREVDVNFVPNANGIAVVAEFLKLVDLSFYDEDVGEYLFPRGLAGGPPPGTDNWEKGQLSWDYVTEAALHRFIVRMHARGEVVQEGGNHGHWRDAVLIEHTRGIRAAIVGKPDEGLVEIRFDPRSPIEQRGETWNYVKDLFVNEFIGLEPVRESEAPVILVTFESKKAAFPGTNAMHDALALRKDLADQDAVRSERVTALAQKLLGFSAADREFIRVFFGRTGHHEFGGETGRIAFRAAYFYWCFLRMALKQVTTKAKLPRFTWPMIFDDFLEGKQSNLKELSWESFGDAADKPESEEGLRKSLAREKNQSLRKSLDAINPYVAVGRGPISNDDL